MDVVGIVFVALGGLQKPVWRSEAFVNRVDADAMAQEKSIGFSRDPMDGPRPDLHPKQRPWILDFPDRPRDGVWGDCINVLVEERALIEYTRRNRGRQDDRCETG